MTDKLAGMEPQAGNAKGRGMTKEPRDYCPECGYDVAITRGGKWRRHAIARGAYALRGDKDINICPMSGQSARERSEPPPQTREDPCT